MKLGVCITACLFLAEMSSDIAVLGLSSVDECQREKELVL